MTRRRGKHNYNQGEGPAGKNKNNRDYCECVVGNNSTCPSDMYCCHGNDNMDCICYITEDNTNTGVCRQMTWSHECGEWPNIVC